MSKNDQIIKFYLLIFNSYLISKASLHSRLRSYQKESYDVPLKFIDMPDNNFV